MWLSIGSVLLVLSIGIAWWIRGRGAVPPSNAQTVSTPSGAPIRCWADETRTKKKVTGYRVGVSIAGAFDIVIRPETRFDRWARSMGIVAEQTTMDAAFDETFFIDSNDLRVGRALRHDRDAREAIVQIDAHCRTYGCSMLAIRARRAKLWVEIKDPTGLPGPDALGRLAAALSVVAGALVGRVMDAAGEGPRDRFRPRAVAVVGLSTGLLAFGLLALTRWPSVRLDLDPARLWWLSIGIGTIATLVGMLLILRWLASSTRAHWVLLEWATIGFAGVVLTLHAFAMEANREFDDAPAEIVGPIDGRMTEETYKCGKHRNRTCTRYLFDPAPGAIAGIHEALRIDHRLYSMNRGHTRFVVHIKPGRLACRWIQSIEPARVPGPG